MNHLRLNPFATRVLAGLLLHQAAFAAPAGPVERELLYSCTLEGVQP